MGFVEDLLATGYQPATKPRPKHPRGWEPGVDTESGVATTVSDTPPVEGGPDWSAWLEAWGFDPAVFTVEDDKVEVRTWDAPIGNGEVTRLWYYKARIVKRRQPVDLAAEIRRIKKQKPLKTATTGPATLIVALADWQLAKRDGDGTRGTVERVYRLEQDLLTHTKTLHKSGVEVGHLIVAGLGDLVEGCLGHGPKAAQQFLVEYDRREQINLARRLLLRLLSTWAPRFEQVTVVAVPGNHGENRNAAGRVITQPSDNDDVAVFEQVRDVLAENEERYGHVEWAIPSRELTVTVPIPDSELVVGFAHGHQSGQGGPTAASKVWTWWKSQSHARRAVGDADILVTGHFHYLSVIENGARTHLQAPPLDGGSDWFAEKYGYESQSGTLTVVVAGDGWDWLRIL